MDSFYRLSQHTNTLSCGSNDMFVNPMVPDVSMCTSAQMQQKPDAHLSYDAWKSTQISRKLKGTSANTTYRQSNVTNSPSDFSTQVSNNILRKQVRFRNPKLPQNIKNTISDNVFECKEIFGPFKDGRNDNKISDFENIYLANIPNRKLDLSIIEPHLPKCAKVNGNCSKLAQLEKRDLPVYDILNYKSPVNQRTKDCMETVCDNFDTGNHLTIKNKPVNLPIFDNKKHHLNEQTPQLSVETNPPHESSAALVPSHNIHNDQHFDQNDQPTVRDLFKIIQQQNEQLLILQKQVATLIDNQQKTIENQPNEPTCQVFDKDKFCPKNKNHILPNKFNIDVMTSFEVSIRPQQKTGARPFDGCHKEAKIQEITEHFHNTLQLNQINSNTETNRIKGQANELSLMLNEPLQVQEGTLSPDQSVHVDMHDYSSDSDCNSDDSPDLRWTIYNNVMGQVNNILTKANVARMNQMGTKPNSNDKIKTRTMKKVKEATLRHLQSIGVHVHMDDPIDSLSTQTTTDALDYSPTEISFAVQQLLMKYLPNEYLAKVANNKEDIQQNVPNVCQRNKNGPNVNLVPRRPEFSFATVQYMKKYNLLASLEEESIKIPQIQNNIPVQQKFLDITALKQQPKLL